MPTSFHCVFCGDRIGFDEPIIVVEHEGGERETSLAHEPELADRTRQFLIHARCAPAADQPPPPQSRFVER